MVSGPHGATATHVPHLTTRVTSVPWCFSNLTLSDHSYHLYASFLYGRRGRPVVRTPQYFSTSLIGCYSWDTVDRPHATVTYVPQLLHVITSLDIVIINFLALYSTCVQLTPDSSCLGGSNVHSWLNTFSFSSNALSVGHTADR